MNDMEELEKLEHKVEALTAQVSQLQKSVEDLVIAWNTAKGLTAFIKWSASLVTAAAVIWALLHGKLPT